MRSKESPANRTLPGSGDNTQIAARGQELAEDASQKLLSDDIQGFFDGYKSLWELFDENESNASVAESLGDAIRDLGLYRIKRSDYIQLAGCVKEACKLSDRFPDSISIAGNYVILLTGMFDFRAKLGDHDYTEDYIPEVLALGGRFPENEEFMARSATCIANLLRLCSVGGASPDVLMPLLDRLAEILKRFSDRRSVRLANIRGLTEFFCAIKPHGWKGGYKAYYMRLSELCSKDLSLLTSGDTARLRYMVRSLDAIEDEINA